MQQYTCSASHAQENRKSLRTGDPENSGFSRIQLKEREGGKYPVSLES